MDVSRFRAAPVAQLSGLSLEGQRAFPSECWCLRRGGLYPSPRTLHHVLPQTGSDVEKLSQMRVRLSVVEVSFDRNSYNLMHRDPRTATRLQHIHGPHDPTIGRTLRGRVGMDGSILRPSKSSRIAATVRSSITGLGKALRRAGEWIEDAAVPAGCRCAP